MTDLKRFRFLIVLKAIYEHTEQSRCYQNDKPGNHKWPFLQGKTKERLEQVPEPA